MGISADRFSAEASSRDRQVFQAIKHRWRTAARGEAAHRYQDDRRGLDHSASPTKRERKRESEKGGEDREGGVGGCRGVHLGDRWLSEISQRWSSCRIITRSTPPSRPTPSAQVAWVASRRLFRRAFAQDRWACSRPTTLYQPTIRTRRRQLSALLCKVRCAYRICRARRMTSARSRASSFRLPAKQ